MENPFSFDPFCQFLIDPQNHLKIDPLKILTGGVNYSLEKYYSTHAISMGLFFYYYCPVKLISFRSA